MECRFCLSNVARYLLLVLSFGTPRDATILYPSGTTQISNVDISPQNFPMPSGGIKMLARTYFVCKIDKTGGMVTSVPSTTPVYTMHLWSGSELNFVNHPTGTLYTTTLSDSDPDPDNLLPRASAEVTAAFSVSYTATKLAIMTYDLYTSDGSSSPPTNTFQLVLITDGSASYIQFNYPPEQMGWWQDANNNYPSVKIEYDGTNLITIPGSGTSEIQTNLPQGNTPNSPGRWMFKIDGTCPTCSSPAGGYMTACEGNDPTKCVCSSCDSVELVPEATTTVTAKPSGLTQEQKTIVISTSVVGGAALVAMAVGLGVYFGKYKDKNALKKQRS